MINLRRYIIDFLSRHNYVTLQNQKLSNSFCDTSIAANPLWNHVIGLDSATLKLVSDELNSLDLLMSFHEAINLVWATRETAGIPGEMAEVGSYSGSSALLMCASSKIDSRTINLFDTFSGIPEVTHGIDNLEIGDVAGASLELVKTKLLPYSSRVKYHVGFFPDSTYDISKETHFSLVNLDADTYQTTLTALEFFYPRIPHGGIILCHDYSSISCPGVRKAIDKFFLYKVENVIPLWHTQALIIKN